MSYRDIPTMERLNAVHYTSKRRPPDVIWTSLIRRLDVERLNKTSYGLPKDVHVLCEIS